MQVPVQLVKMFHNNIIMQIAEMHTEEAIYVYARITTPGNVSIYREKVVQLSSTSLTLNLHEGNFTDTLSKTPHDFSIPWLIVMVICLHSLQTM